MHQVAYLRNSFAHTPKPTLAEAVAGVMAMLEVMRDHNQPVEEMLVLLKEVQEASWLATGACYCCFGT